MARFVFSSLTIAAAISVAGLALALPAAAQLMPKESVFTLSSSDFTDGGVLPARYSCDKEGDSPPLHWENVPEHVKTYALMAHDPDAPAGAYVHWIVYNMPDNTRDLPAGAAAKPDLGLKARQGMNGAGKPGWTPACPPSGEHHYIFRIYALDNDVPLNAETTLDRKGFEAAIEGHVLGQAELTGRYARSK
jgi:Raf kinase inhibitor-like YbhB/YbcL family protein